MNYTHGFARRVSLVAGLALVSFTLACCNQSGTPGGMHAPIPSVIAPASNYHADWSNQPAFIQNAIAVQGRHENDLLNIPGVIGDGVGLDVTNPNAAAILVFTNHDGVSGIPATVEGLRTRIEMVGTVTAFQGIGNVKDDGKGHGGGGSSTGYTGTYRSPIPAGVSCGDNDECAAGSIGAMVTSSGITASPQSGSITTYSHNSNYSWSGGNTGSTPVYMLSCNHVFANENGATAADAMDQPGRYDNSCNAGNNVGTLYAWNDISSTSNTLYDAAIAECDPSIFGGWTGAMYQHYAPATGSSAIDPTVGMAVEKVGRTTGLTTGSISGINVTIKVSYTNFTATFVNQIYVRGSFIKSGDSGSMMVTDDANHDPVGLDFAGSSRSSFANRIKPIEEDFGLSFESSTFGN